MKKTPLWTLLAWTLLTGAALAQNYWNTRNGNMEFLHGPDGYHGYIIHNGDFSYLHDSCGHGYGVRLGNTTYWHYNRDDD